MDPFRRNRPLNSQAKLNGSELQRRKHSKVAETDENELPFLNNNGAPTMSRDSKTTELKKNALFSKTSSFKKKILAERNEEPPPDSSLSSHLEITPQSKGIPRANPGGASFQNTPISSHSYDPITNFTSPRPKFLRYNPNQRRELLKRIEVEKVGKEEVHSESSLSTPNSSSKRGNDSDYEEEEEFEEKPLSSFVVWSVLLIFGVSSFISYSMGPGSSYPSFEGNESYVDDIQKVQGKAHRSTLVGKSLFSTTSLGSLMSSSQMCPILRESLCNPEENLFGPLREHLGEGESDRTEVLVPEGRDLLLKNGGIGDDDSASKEKMELVDQNQKDFGLLAEGNANKSITSVETLKENNTTSSSVESSLVSVAQDVSDSLSTVKKDKFLNESLDSIELSSISQSRAESAPPDVQDLENFNFSSASETELKSYFSSNILSEGVLPKLLIFLGSLTIVIGSLSCFHKHFRRMKFNSLHVTAPSPPPSEFCRKTETGEEIVTEVSMKEENLDKALDMSVKSKSSSRSNSVSSTSDYTSVELKKVSGFEPPRVELLGEFSLMDERVAADNGFGSNLIKMENQNSQFSYNQNGKARKMLSPLPNMLDSSPEKSTSSRFSSKVPSDKCEISDTSTSSLRRSSRLRSQIRANRFVT